MSEKQGSKKRPAKGESLRTCGFGYRIGHLVASKHIENALFAEVYRRRSAGQSACSESTGAGCSVASWNATCRFGQTVWFCAERCEESLELARTLAWDAGVWVPRTCFEVAEDLTDQSSYTPARRPASLGYAREPDGVPFGCLWKPRPSGEGS